MTWEDIFLILSAMRRSRGQLLPLELDILEAALDLRAGGEPEFHGFAVAKRLQEQESAKRLTAHGTLYKALARLEQAGLLESTWEDAQLAAAAGRPRRRLYRVTGDAEVAVRTARTLSARVHRSGPGLQPT